MPTITNRATRNTAPHQRINPSATTSRRLSFQTPIQSAYKRRQTSIGCNCIYTKRRVPTCHHRNLRLFPYIRRPLRHSQKQTYTPRKKHYPNRRPYLLPQLRLLQLHNPTLRTTNTLRNRRDSLQPWSLQASSTVRTPRPNKPLDQHQVSKPHNKVTTRKQNHQHIPKNGRRPILQNRKLRSQYHSCNHQNHNTNNPSSRLQKSATISREARAKSSPQSPNHTTYKPTLRNRPEKQPSQDSHPPAFNSTEPIKQSTQNMQARAKNKHLIITNRTQQKHPSPKQSTTSQDTKRDTPQERKLTTFTLRRQLHLISTSPTHHRITRRLIKFSY